MVRVSGDMEVHGLSALMHCLMPSRGQFPASRWPEAGLIILIGRQSGTAPNYRWCFPAIHSVTPMKAKPHIDIGATGMRRMWTVCCRKGGIAEDICANHMGL